jgi:EAL domain-containing protein (putative c-di-GMP-specific phosphodiesterase class I)
MVQLSADTAVVSAGAALWTWSQTTGEVVVRAEAGGPLAWLDGAWKLSELLGQLDGLARPILLARLRNGKAGSAVDVRVTLSSGLHAHVVGAFHDEGIARGLIICSERKVNLPETNVIPVFQPIRRVSDLTLGGFEALARFRMPDGRIVGPDALVGLGGETDWKAIAPVMLQRSAEMLADLRARGEDVFMQVNLSAAEISNPGLVEQVAELIRAFGFPQGCFRIELTEQAALRDFDAALGSLAGFRAAGAGVVLDDFGGGHSSFAWLAEFPAEGVKLDPKLIRMLSRPRAGAIVAALTGIIRDLGMTVTAEAVEDRATIQKLREMRCDYVQGFVFDLPLHAEDIGAAFDPVTD